MKLFEYDNFPDVLIKVSEKKEYLEDIVNGSIFMNESGYFRKLEDNYRGDKNDGKCPIDLSNLKGEFFELKPVDGSMEGIRMPIEFIHNFTLGFDGDSKIPLFCCSQLDENILVKETETVLKFKSEFIDEMCKFGKYFLMFHKFDLVKNISDYVIQNNMGAKWGPVCYQNIYSAYDIGMVGDDKLNQYERFFQKDNLYRNQNEWRVLLVSDGDKPLIGETQSSFVANIGALSWCYIGEISELKDTCINIKKKEEKQGHD